MPISKLSAQGTPFPTGPHSQAAQSSLCLCSLGTKTLILHFAEQKGIINTPFTKEGTSPKSTALFSLVKLQSQAQESNFAAFQNSLEKKRNLRSLGSESS